jgi:hypothetical protein
MMKSRIALACLAALLIFLIAGGAWAGSSANFAVVWQVLVGGGAPAESDSGTVALNGTLGQPIIGPSSSSTAGLEAGYWYAVGKEINWASQPIYLPVVIQNH